MTNAIGGVELTLKRIASFQRKKLSSRNTKRVQIALFTIAILLLIIHDWAPKLLPAFSSAPSWLVQSMALFFAGLTVLAAHSWADEGGASGKLTYGRVLAAAILISLLVLYFTLNLEALPEWAKMLLHLCGFYFWMALLGTYAREKSERVWKKGAARASS